uniref:tRNA (cytosine(34)-C(5))-methyltransferase n=1 Tax=Cacopsylla melanoneura TaxID=428564 RepID=A0A8D8X5V2_9HEMI
MAKGRRFHNRQKSFAQKRREKNQNKEKPRNDTNRQNYADIVRENKDFEQYYKAQKICPEAEWDSMLESLKKDLPTAFRITNCSPGEAKALLSIVESKFFKELVNDQETSEEEKVAPICMPWYPERMGWQLQLSRKDIRRSQAYSKLHQFLILETNTSRQEAVSMIPPLLLDVQTHHKVLDMCAAPGSKTAQIIEMIHAADSNPVPSGLVVANDVDNNRCYMLVHQAKRLNSPCAIITNHDASVMPNVLYTDDQGQKVPMKFDRVLCDVPCTGDGTMRKNPDIWTKWTPSNGNNLHGIQYRIFKRGVEMLAVGGKIAYSTCSLNPLEDEAVIQRLIVETQGAVQLVDVSQMVPTLKYAPGLSHWKPASKDNLEGYNSFEEVPEKWHTQVRPSMFPTGDPSFHLERCLRLLPHQQDTGGFFIAVLEKVRPLPSEQTKIDREAAYKSNLAAGEAAKTAEVKCDVPANDGAEAASNLEPAASSPSREPPSKKRKRQPQGYKEDPFIFFTEEEAVWPAIRDFYEISPSLPTDCLLTRCLVGKKKIIYFTSPMVKNIIQANEGNLKIVNTGVKCFVRCDNKVMSCAFRLGQEGLSSLKGFIGEKRKVRVNREELVTILNNSTPEHPTDLDKLRPETRQLLGRDDFGIGSCLLELQDKDLPISLVGWRGKSSVRAYVSGSDIVHYLRLLGADVSKFEVNKFDKKKTSESELNEEDAENKETNSTPDDQAEGESAEPSVESAVA